MKSAQGIFASLLSIALVSACLAQAPSRQRLTPLDQALDLYQEYSGKTIIRSPHLPSLTEFNKPTPSSDTNGMRVAFENELLKTGIEFIPLHDVFVLAVESGWKASATADYVANIKPPPTGTTGSASRVSEPEAIPPGTIDFRGAELRQFLDVYATLLNRNILLSGQVSSSTFAIRTQTPITKTDAIYLLEVSLALDGIASVEDGTNFVQVVPLKQVSNIKVDAPRSDASEPRIHQKDIQQFGGLEFIPGKPPKRFRASANDLVAYYGELTGRAAIPSERAGRQTVQFRMQTSLTKPELLYALETTLALNGLAVIQGDDKTISVGYTHESNKTASKSP